MKWAVLLLACAASGQRPGIVSYSRHGNRFVFQVRDGAAELEWRTPSTFRFRRTFSIDLPPRSEADVEPVTVDVKETADAIRFSTTFLTASIQRDDLRVSARKADGALLMSDATAAQNRSGVISWERASEPGVRYYGLGARTAASLNLRGMLVHDAVPFLFSTAGYGEQHVASAKYDFDLERLRRGRYRIDVRGSDTIDYYFYYGPTPKEIFEERLKTRGANFAAHAAPPSLQWMLEQSLSGVVLPAQTVLTALPIELRNRMEAYLGAYVQEVHDRGCPILHPLPVQFPRDAEADQHPDESMVGDELLVSASHRVYLPQGIWTNLKTNAVTGGRQVVQERDVPAIFARNGSIVPLTGDGTLELHYFPKLGAEFFLYEEDVGDYSQLHAAPAADVMRFEIESKVERDYTWIVHHIESVRTVAVGDAQFKAVPSHAQLVHGTWYYDSTRQNLYIRDRVSAGQDHIINVSF